MAIDTKMQAKRLGVLFALGFLLVFGYAIARTSIDSLFLEHFSSQILPKAWLITAMVSFIVISFYNNLNQRYAILSLYKIGSLLCAIFLLLLLTVYLKGYIWAIFILYIWKEIYMVVLMETYWSFADIVFSTKMARFTYGSAMAVCSVGGVLGNLLVGPMAKTFGTANSLYFLVALLVLGFLIVEWSKDASDDKPKKKESTDLSMGIKTLLKSKYLVPLAILVLNVQIVVGLIDYAFNVSLQENYTNLDLRTEVFGQVHAVMNALSIIMQLFMGSILKIFGISGAFVGIPTILSLGLGLFIVAPGFVMVLIVRILSKALDYSWLRGVKEILYIPLSREEKTQGKGLIDIFIYRMARGISSLILLALLSIGLSDYIMPITLLLTIVWLILAIVVGKRYQREYVHDR